MPRPRTSCNSSCSACVCVCVSLWPPTACQSGHVTLAPRQLRKRTGRAVAHFDAFYCLQRLSPPDPPLCPSSVTVGTFRVAEWSGGFDTRIGHSGAPARQLD
uniref:Putative secreted protein n=1 Tax=Anopheles triannulatus TaxID=58253 RepID=A0A2M4B4F6_9DIPT